MDDNAFRAQRARELDDLRNEITELAGHLNAANCRFLKLIAEFDRREGWEEIEPQAPIETDDDEVKYGSSASQLRLDELFAWATRPRATATDANASEKRKRILDSGEPLPIDG